MTMLQEELARTVVPSHTKARAHIINPPMNPYPEMNGMTAQQRVDYAREHQLELRALCGYIWVPKLNPDALEACEACMDIARDFMQEEGE